MEKDADISFRRRYFWAYFDSEPRLIIRHSPMKMI